MFWFFWPRGTGDLCVWPGSEPIHLRLEGEILTTGPPRSPGMNADAFYWSHYTHLQRDLPQYEPQQSLTPYQHTPFSTYLAVLESVAMVAFVLGRQSLAPRAEHLPSSWGDCQALWKRVCKVLVSHGPSLEWCSPRGCYWTVAALSRRSRHILC